MALGEKAVEPLIQILLEEYPHLEKQAEALVAKLGSEDGDERERATLELIKIGARVEDLLKKHAKRLNGEARWRMRRVLGRIKKNKKKEQDLAARQKASICRVLGRLKAFRAAEPLTAAVDHKDPEVRAEAITALGEVRATEGVGKLEDLLRGDPDWRTRGACARSLGKIGDAAAWKALRDYLKDEDEDNERVIWRLMEGLSADPSAEAARLIIERMEAPSATLRHAAFRIAGPRAGLNSESFKAHVKDPENEKTVKAAKRWWEFEFQRKWE